MEERSGFSWWILFALLILLGLFLMVGCASPSAGAGAPVGWLEVRIEAGTGAESAKAFRTADGETIWFGPASWFPLSFVGKTADGTGGPAVTFEVAGAEVARFRSYTEANVGSRMGVFAADGLLTAPVLLAALPGKGILSGGSTSWDVAECDSIRRALRSHRPPPQGE